MKLRIGIITDTEYTPFWAYEMVRMAKELNNVEFPLIILNGDKINKSNNLLKKITSRLHIFVSVAYLTIEQKIFKSKPDAFEAKSFKDLLPKADRLIVHPIKSKFRDKFNDDDLGKIKKYKLDIILCRGFRILSGQILKLPKYGVWSYHHGDNDENRGRPAIFYETLERWNSIGTIFQILNEELDNGLVLYKSKSGHRSRFIFKNMNSVYWKSAFFFKRTIIELQQKGWDKFINEKKIYNNKSINIYDKPLYIIPSNTKALKLLYHHYLRIIKEYFLDKLFIEIWQLAVLNNADISSMSMHRFKLIKIPKKQFWADPIAIKHKNRTFVYFEEFLKSNGKGHISVIEFSDKKKIEFSNPKIVLKKEYHLSYPFVFESDGELFLVPESASINKIDLYKCVELPHKFEFVKTLIPNIKALDSTLIFKDNTWWLFANVVSHPAISSYEELFLFYTDDLINGEWTHHPMNPVISDVRSARPAGQIFKRKGHYYRPSQICTPKYGYGIAINKIITWNKFEYREKVVKQILPNWNKSIRTLHTISQADDKIFIDVALSKLKFFNW